MKQFFKHKFYEKLLSFLKYKRHKKIRNFIFFSKKKMESNSDIKYNPQNLNFFIEKKKLDSFQVISEKNRNNLKKDIEAKTVSHNETTNLKVFSSLVKPREDLTPYIYKLNKKKYQINSFLFNILCKFSKSRVNNLLNHDILFRYYTIPYRLSLSRFIGNKVLRSYYKNINKKSLLNLYKNISTKAKRTIADGRRDNVKKEISKNIILCLEKRLDASLLRLLQFKSLYTKKSIDSYFSQTNEKSLFEANEANTISKQFKTLSLDELTVPLQKNIKTLNPKSIKIKSPWKNFSILQIKQKINHGHIYINEKKVKSANFNLKSDDQVKIRGFISNPLWTSKLKTTSYSSLILQETQQFSDRTNTFFFRNAADFVTDLTFLKTQASKNFALHDVQDNSNLIFKWFTPQNQFFISSSSNADEKEEEEGEKINLNSNSLQTSLNNIFLLCDYIKNLKIKRFSEIFYLTYKNFFLIADSSIFSQQSSLERFNNIKFFFQTIGFNQSIYFLWPLISLLSIQKWNTELKNNIIHNAQNLKNSGTNLKPNLKFQSNALAHTSFGGKSNFYDKSLLIQKNLKNLISLKTNFKNFQLKISSNSVNSGIFKQGLELAKKEETQVYGDGIDKREAQNTNHTNNYANEATTKNEAIIPSLHSSPFFKKLNNSNSLILNNIPIQTAVSSSFRPGSVSSSVSSNNLRNIKNKSNLSSTHSAWLFNKYALDNCYASIVYGTRKCKWVQLQQQKKGGFYNKIYNKINFFELELDFFQLAYRHYKSN